MHPAARYFRDCTRAALGLLRDEPIGAYYGLSGDEAVEINDCARAVLQQAGLKIRPAWKPSSPGMQDRLDRAYTKRGPRPATR